MKKSFSLFADMVALLFVVLWVYAATSKLMDFDNFKVQLTLSPLLTTFANWVAWTVPFAEIAVAVTLTFRQTRLTGLFASFFAMMMFTGYIIAVTRFSDYIPCSCGGILQNMNWDQHLAVNLAFVLLALMSIIFYDTPVANRLSDADAM